MVYLNLTVGTVAGATATAAVPVPVLVFVLIAVVFLQHVGEDVAIEGEEFVSGEVVHVVHRGGLYVDRGRALEGCGGYERVGGCCDVRGVCV